MPRFVFRAQVALDFRQRKADDAKRDLAAANAEVALAQAALDSSKAAYQKTLEDAREQQTQATDLSATEWYRNWILSLQTGIGRRQEELNVRQADADTARERATRMHMELRVLERLKERAKRTHEHAELREEQKAIDWLAVLRTYSRDDDKGNKE
jgi:flagellar export protein FliJ